MLSVLVLHRTNRQGLYDAAMGGGRGVYMRVVQLADVHSYARRGEVAGRTWAWDWAYALREQ